MFLKKILHHISTNITALLCFVYIWFVALTSKISYLGENIPDSFLTENKPFIYGLWHSRQFFLMFSEKNKGASILASKSKDGDYIAKPANFFGIKTIRGSTSKGGAKALMKLIKLVNSGKITAITPDGPRGPREKAQMGIYHIAKKTKAPIIPISFSSSRKKEFSSWDRYQIPYPFSKICVTYGEPLYINDIEPAETALNRIEAALNDNTRKGEKFISKIK